MNLEALARRHALANAVEHDGRAHAKTVIGRIMAESEEARRMKKEVATIAAGIVNDVNALSPDEQRKELEALDPEALKKKEVVERGLPELDGADTGVVMRMAPYPSGPLHIGNARMAILNDEYVKKYGGKLLLVFDDTIGSDEKIPVIEAYGLIEDGLRWLGIDYDDRIYKSDRVELFYEWAEKLIDAGSAYVCECDATTLRGNREKGIACEHRGQRIGETREKWRAMLAGDYAQGTAALRIKTDIAHKNPAFRDRVLCRISTKAHPRIGTRYRVWPLLELSWAADDHVLGMTHVLRGKDLVIEDDMENFIWDVLGVAGPSFYHYGMLRIKEAKLSKSKFMKEVRDGLFSGWDDPRTWSLQSLRRRGIRPAAIRSFILSFGMSLGDIEAPAENLYAENRKLVDPEAHRFFFVDEPVTLTFEEPPAVETLHIPRHPTRDLGTREVGVGPTVHVAKSDYERFAGSEVRLKDFCNIELGEKIRVTSTENKNIQKIQFVCDGVPVSVVMTDGSTVTGLGERALLGAQIDDVVQFERFGFVRIDAIENGAVTAYFAHK